MPKSYKAFNLKFKNKLFFLRDAKILMKDSVYKLKINTSICRIPCLSEKFDSFHIEI